MEVQSKKKTIRGIIDCQNCLNIKRINILDNLVKTCYHNEDYKRAVEFYNRLNELKESLEMCPHEWVFV